MSSDSRTLKPMPLPLALFYFGIPALIFVLCVYILIPFFTSQGVTEFISYSLALMIPLIAMLIASLVALRMEGYPITWASIKERFRLRKMDRTELSHVAQKRKNTWPGIITHFAVNGLSLLPILAAILR